MRALWLLVLLGTAQAEEQRWRGRVTSEVQDGYNSAILDLVPTLFSDGTIGVVGDYRCVPRSLPCFLRGGTARGSLLPSGAFVGRIELYGRRCELKGRGTLPTVPRTRLRGRYRCFAAIRSRFVDGGTFVLRRVR